MAQLINNVEHMFTSGKLAFHATTLTIAIYSFSHYNNTPEEVSIHLMS